MTDYNLPDIVAPEGTIKLTLRHPTYGLHVPTDNTIISVGPDSRALDFLPGEIRIASFQINFIEDYSYYTTEGFWHKMLEDTGSGEPLELRVVFNDTGTDQFVFWGVLEPQYTQFKEAFTDDSIQIRTGQAQFRDALIDKFKLVQVTDILSDVDTNAVEGISQWNMYAKVFDIFASATIRGFDPTGVHPNQTFAASQPTWLGAGGNDLDFLSGSTRYGLPDLYWPIRHNTSTPPATVYALQGYADSGSPDYWPTKFKNGWELIKAICLNFCMVPGHSYDLVNDIHKIVLYQRGRAFTDVLSFADKPMDSDVIMGQYILNSAVAFNRRDHAIYYFISSFGGYGGTYYGDAALPNESFDHTVDCEFLLTGGATQPWQTLYVAPAQADAVVDSLRYWDYSTGGYTSDFSNETAMQRVIVEYMFHRYQSMEMLQRHYPSVEGIAGGVTSQASIDLVRALSIYSEDWSVVNFAKDFSGTGVDLTLVKL